MHPADSTSHTAQTNHALAPTYPDAPAPGFSLIRALGPSQPATGTFWTGLFMLLAGIVLTVCPFLLGVTLLIGSGANPQSPVVSGPIGASACFAVILIFPGVLLIALGRPRRGGNTHQ